MSFRWDGETYAKHSAPQRDWALDFLRRCLSEEDVRLVGLEPHGEESGEVLDIGCGDGGISAWLATQKFPSAKVVGIDISKGQLEYAKNAHKAIANLTFELYSAVEMPKEWHARFNLVLSFNALHWVKDHHLFLQQAHHVLREGGMLAFTLPLVGSSGYVRAIRAVCALPQWSPYLENCDLEGYPHNPHWIEDFIAKYHPSPRSDPQMELGQLLETQKQEFIESYRELLAKCSFAGQVVAIHPGPAHYEKPEELKKFIEQWLPHNQKIPEPQRDQFMEDFMELLLKGEDPDVWFNFQVTARKLILPKA